MQNTSSKFMMIPFVSVCLKYKYCHEVVLKPLHLDFKTAFDDASMISFIYEIPSGMPLHFNDSTWISD